MTATGPHLAFASDGEEWGGAEVCLQALVRSATADAGRVTVIGVDAMVVDRLVAAGPPGTVGELLPPRSSPLDARPVGRACVLLRRLRPDLLHVNASFTFGSLPMQLAAVIAGVPFVVQEHLPLAPGRPRVQRPVKRWLASRAGAVVAVGERAARETETHAGLPAGSVGVIVNGVGMQQTPPQRSDWPGPVLVTVGRLTRQKGVDTVISSLPALPGTQLVVVGDGPERDALVELAATLGVQDRVVFLGARSDARAWMAGGDVVVLASRWEAGPLAAIEGMAECRPVVLTDVGAARAMLSGTGVEPVPVDDVPALTTALRALVEDPAAARAAGRMARSVAESRYDQATMTASWAALYASVIAGR